MQGMHQSDNTTSGAVALMDSSAISPFAASDISCAPNPAARSVQRSILRIARLSSTSRMCISAFQIESVAIALNAVIGLSRKKLRNLLKRFDDHPQGRWSQLSGEDRSMAEQTPVTSPRATPGLLRVLLLISGLFMMLVQIHRSCGAVIANELAAHGYTPSQIASVVGMLFFAAALCQLPTGILFDRYGACRTMAGLGVLGIAGIVLFALADSVVGLSVGRFLIGIGQGGTIAGIYLLVLNWVPAERVATTTGAVVAISGGIGGVLATVPLVLLLEATGHQHAFLMIAAVTTLVTIALGVFVRDTPRDKQTRASTAGETFAQSVRGLWAVLTDRKLWPVFAMGSCFAMPFHTVGGLWAGPYLVDVYAMEVEQMGFAVLAMVAAFHLGTLLYGPMERLVGSQKRTIVGGVLIMITLLVVLAIRPQIGLAPSIVLLVLFCLCTPYFPVLAAHCRSFVPLSRAGRAIACVNLTGIGTVFIMQKFTGWIVELNATSAGNASIIGYQVTFLSVAVLLALAVTAYLQVRDVPQ